MTRQSKSKPLFADFGLRIVALIIDFIIVLFVATALTDHVLVPVGLAPGDNRSVMTAIMVLYFAVSWVSPLRASPGPLVTDMRVVSASLETLTLLRAIIRSLALTGLIAGAFLIVEQPTNELFVLAALTSFALIYLAAVTPDRKGGHDWVAKSIVVSRRALKDSERREKLVAHLADDDPTTRKHRRPTIRRMIGDGVGIAVPFFVLMTGSQVQYQRDLIYRTSYAYSETHDIRTAVALHYLESGEWPDADSEIGMPARVDYPDGGFYELEDDGVVRIHFTVIPDLTKGTIVLSPAASEDDISWGCHSEGEIERGYLPSMCRD
jgi:uncharacterized RDD family membrane protein YckC